MAYFWGGGVYIFADGRTREQAGQESAYTHTRMGQCARKQVSVRKNGMQSDLHKYKHSEQ